MAVGRVCSRLVVGLVKCRRARSTVAPQTAPRMGSFTSTPKILNEDHEDNDIIWEEQRNKSHCMAVCQKELQHLPPIITRTWAQITPPDPGSATIRVLQWNMLSQALGYHKDNFVCCPEEALDWSTRRYRVLEEILSQSPDIMCAQEVDHYNFFFKALESLNYGGTFFPKPDSPCLYIPNNNGPDGCAIFYNKDNFELVSIETRVVEVWHVQTNQVVILMTLRHRKTGVEICVATTHLKARSGALLSTIRNEQGKDILTFLNERVGSRAVVLCGDFNAEPSEPVYRTITTDQRLPLSSSYKQVTGEEPPYTTWKIRGDGEKCHTLDYVFYTRDKLKTCAVLNMPTGEDLGEGRAPSLTYPSDHFSLVVDLQFR